MRGRRIVAAAIVAWLAVGCAAKEPAQWPTSTFVAPTITVASDPAPTETPEPTPEPSATFDPDQLAAAETVLTWMRLWHEAEADLEAPVEEFALMMMGDTQTRIMARLADVRNAGQIGVGTVRVHITGAEPTEQQAVGKSVYVLACTDASEYDLVDADTKVSVLDPQRGFFVHWRINVIHSEGGNRWLISNFTSDLGEPCVD